MSILQQPRVLRFEPFELDSANGELHTACADGGPWLVEVPVEPGGEASPWQFIHPKPHPGAPVEVNRRPWPA